jgi:hypothetical protein
MFSIDNTGQSFETGQKELFFHSIVAKSITLHFMKKSSPKTEVFEITASNNSIISGRLEKS